MAPQTSGARSSVLSPLGDPPVSGGGETTAAATGGAAVDPAATTGEAGAAPGAPNVDSPLPKAFMAGGAAMTIGGGTAFAVGTNKVAKAATQTAVREATERLAVGGVASIGNAASAGAAAIGKLPGFLKWGGLGAAAVGLGVLGMGIKGNNEQKLQKAQIETIQAYESQIGPAIQQMRSDYETQLAAAQTGGGATADATGQQTDAGAAGADAAAMESEIGAMTGGSMTGEAAPMIQLPDAPAAGGVGGASGTAGTGDANGGALIGSTIDLAAGIGANGTPIAEAGTYAIARDLGSFATLDEANAAVRATMDPDALGTRYLRYAVVQSGNSFHAVVAQALEGGQPKPLTAQQGQVVAWNALGHVSDANGNSGWQAYSWTAQGGATSIPVAYGEKPFPSGVGASTTPTPGTTTPTTGTTTPTPGTTTSTVGGGAPVAGTTAGAPFDPNSALGRTFSINASTTEGGSIISGGAIQLQGFVASSTGGFGTAEQAAVAARQARTQLDPSNPYARVISMQGSDGRYYVYQASVVARETAPLQGAAPMHVFGAGFASYYDGATSAWQSIADQ